MPSEESYFEDVEIIDEFEIGRHTPSRDEIVSFARQWDPQPFHVDDEAARRSVMGGLCASSCHTYSISSLIFSRSEKRLRTAAMLGLEMRFPNPVRPDEELTLYEQVLDKRVSASRPGYGIVQSRTTLRNARGEDVMVMESSFLVDRRPSGMGSC
jgi:acyl dehydratase